MMNKTAVVTTQRNITAKDVHLNPYNDQLREMRAH